MRRICGTPLLRAYKWQKFLPFLWMCIKFVLPLRCSPMLTTPNKISVIAKDCSVTSHSRSQEQNVSQTVSVTLQWNTECSMDSTSLLQNVHNGESNVYKTTKIKGLPRLETNSAIFKTWSQRHFISVIAENKPHANQVTIPFLFNPHLHTMKVYKNRRTDQ